MVGPWDEWMPYWAEWPPSEEEAERQFQQSVGPFVYVPLDLPNEEPPKVLLQPFIFTEEGV